MVSVHSYLDFLCDASITNQICEKSSSQEIYTVYMETSAHEGDL